MSAAGKYRDELIATARGIATSGKGILAGDESVGTIGNRFKPIDVENNEENRRAYRELLITSEGIEKYISGMIMFEESLDHKCEDGTPFVELLQKKGIYIGIKVDKGPKPIPGGRPNETFTQGLDGLAERCAKYYSMGCRFAKWRAVLCISLENGSPSIISVKENANGLASYAAICQANGLVPIVEPEVLMDGDHDLVTAERVTEHVLIETYKALHDANVLLEGTLLKPNMVCAGSKCTTTYTPQDIAVATITALRRGVPVAVPGINFLSGGLSEEQASIFLSAINSVPGPKPWNISFSYGRALQASCLKAWLGKKENVPAAQSALMERAKANSEAAEGKYQSSSDQSGAANESLFVSNYVY